MCAEIFKGPVDRYIHDTVCDNTEVTLHVVHARLVLAGPIVLRVVGMKQSPCTLLNL